METPFFSQKQFLDAPLFNNAAAAVSGDFGVLGYSEFRPGLLRSDFAYIAFMGLTATVQLPLPFGVMFGETGVIAQGHGTTTGGDSPNYSVSFSGLVPASGSVTAYIGLSLSQIQQDAVQIIGPPPGHPDYSPDFQPYSSYLVSTDSLAVTATTTPPDNVSIFELLRTTLTAGQTSITAYDLYAQVSSVAPWEVNTVEVGTNKVLNMDDSSKLQKATVSGVIFTLPSVSGNASRIYPFAADPGCPCGVQTQNGDLIYGVDTGGVTGVNINDGQTLALHCDGKIYQAIASSAQNFTGASGLVLATPISGSGPATLRHLTLSDLPAYSAAGSIVGLVPTSILTTQVTITAGAGADSTNVTTLILPAPVTWSVANGNNVNGYQGGTTLPNSQTIHFFVIGGSAGTGTFASLSLTPTLPTGYTLYRRIFSLRTFASGNQFHTAYAGGVAFEIGGGALNFYFSRQLLDVQTATTSMARTLVALSVPSGIRVAPSLRMVGATNDTDPIYIILTSPDEVDVAPSDYSDSTGFGTAPGFDFGSDVGSTIGDIAVTYSPGGLITNTAAQVGVRGVAVAIGYSIVTRGFVDFRRT